MKIERIDEKTVKCFISNEELEEFEITYKDFITRSDKAKEVVEEIIEQAVAEVDYKPPKFAMDMQIMVIPEKGMLITLSEKCPEDLKENPMMKAYLQEMRNTLEKHFGDIVEQVKENASGKEQPAEKEPAATKRPDFAVFQFGSMWDLCEFVKVLPHNLRINSSLYRLERTYFLYMQKGGASYERYSRACIHALEYGTLFGATEDKVVYLKEHADCLIEEKAVAKLRL